MPTNITEVDEYTANVPVPNDGEPANAASLLALAQPLANRTENLGNSIAATDATHTAFAATFSACDLSLAGTSVASSGKFTPAIVRQTGGYSIVSNELKVPRNGYYTLHGALSVVAQTGNNVIVSAGATGTSGGGDSTEVPLSTEAPYNAPAPLASLIQIIDYVNDTIVFQNASAVAASLASTQSRVVVQFVRP